MDILEGILGEARIQIKEAKHSNCLDLLRTFLSQEARESVALIESNYTTEGLEAKIKFIDGIDYKIKIEPIL